MNKLVIQTTQRQEVIDFTELLSSFLQEQHRRDGVCHLFLTHTTAALTTSLLDPEQDIDLIGAIDLVIPHFTYDNTNIVSGHTHHRSHLSSHLISSLIGTSMFVMYEKGLILLGKYQRLVLIEMHGPAEREILVS